MFLTSKNSKSSIDVDVTSCDENNEIMPNDNANSDFVMEIFVPSIHDGFVESKDDLFDATPIKVLRDTGSSQSFILTDTLPFSNNSYLGSNFLIKSVDYTNILQCRSITFI